MGDLFCAIAGLPAMVIAGPVFGKFIAKRIHVAVPEHYEHREVSEEHSLSFSIVLAIVLLPLVLIMLGTLAPFIFSENIQLKKGAQFIGHPFVALTLATLITMLVTRFKCGYSKSKILKVANKALEPAGIIILITGAGGAFKQLLVDSGVGKMLGELFVSTSMPVLLLAFVIAAITRIAQGSATVAMITAAGLVAPIIELKNMEGPMLGLVVIAISSGATMLSHVNDSGFWLVSRYLGMSEKDTLKSWTVLSTIIALVGLAVCLLLSVFFNS